MPLNISQTIETDLLIVGSGIAGLSACVEAYSKGIHATLISKAPIGSGASYFPLKATLGIQVTGEAQDKPLFQQDIERVGCGKTNLNVVKAYIEDSPQAIELLARIGFRPWKRNDNRPACFAQYARPIYLINDWRNAALRAKEIIVAQHTPVYENATLLYILTEQNQVQGAVFSVQASGQISYVFCKTAHIILASGGIAGLYQDNLYPADVIGSTHAIAHQAGAKLVNLAFIQFIPAFIEPKYKVLFGEHTLKYVTKITDQHGKDLFAHLSPEQFQQMMLERSHYAPFSTSFACVEFDLVMMKHLLEHPEEKGITLHYSPALYQDKEEFYVVYLKWLKEEVGIDLLTDHIVIAPFAHSCNGGIEIDENGQSCVQGLFAIGEVSHCIEGANRMGGNSVGGSLVFAKRAVQQILKNLNRNLQNTEQNRPLVSLAQGVKACETWLAAQQNPNADPHFTTSDLLREIRVLMARYANIYRTHNNLLALQQKLNAFAQRFDPIAHQQHQGIEVAHTLKTAQLLVEHMLQEETLGAHYLAE